MGGVPLDSHDHLPVLLLHSRFEDWKSCKSRHSFVDEFDTALQGIGCFTLGEDDLVD